MRTLLQLAILFAWGGVASAQSTFTQYVKSQKSGDGKVVIKQDASIDSVVNKQRRVEQKKATPSSKMPSKLTSGVQTEQKTSGSKREESKTETFAGEQRVQQEDSIRMHGTRQRYKASGYRIQIFTGSNSRQDKLKAYSIGEKCQRKFPMLSVYPRFINPRWVCRVGDFRTHEDAMEYVKKIRAARISTEVRVVKCEVLLAR